jgi:hypothetical protein
MILFVTQRVLLEYPSSIQVFCCRRLRFFQYKRLVKNALNFYDNNLFYSAFVLSISDHAFTGQSVYTLVVVRTEKSCKFLYLLYCASNHLRAMYLLQPVHREPTDRTVRSIVTSVPMCVTVTLGSV